MPYFLLKPIQVAWLTTLNITLKNRYSDFLAYRQLTLANVTINSSVNRLTRALWDNFDSTQKIYLLQNATYHQSAYTFLSNEYHPPLYDYLKSENLSTDFDYLAIEETLAGVNFVVRIPIALATKKNAIYAFVNKYIFSSVTFKVETF